MRPRERCCPNGPLMIVCRARQQRRRAEQAQQKRGHRARCPNGPASASGRYREYAISPLEGHSRNRPMLDSKADDPKLLGQVIDYYHAALKESPLALEYLQARDTHAEAVDRFRIGFADRTLGLKLPSKKLKAGR